MLMIPKRIRPASLSSLLAFHMCPLLRRWQQGCHTQMPELQKFACGVAQEQLKGRGRCLEVGWMGLLVWTR